MQWCSKPGVTRSSPSAVILSTMRWQTEKLGTIQQSNVFTRLRCVSRPCQMLRSLRRRCQPLGQPAACLSSVDPFRLRPAPICSDLFEETDDDHDEGDKTKLESQIAQLIQNSHRITHRESSQENYHRHHERREREREREKGRGGGMRRWAMCSWLISHIFESNLGDRWQSLHLLSERKCGSYLFIGRKTLRSKPEQEICLIKRLKIYLDETSRVCLSESSHTLPQNGPATKNIVVSTKCSSSRLRI